MKPKPGGPAGRPVTSLSTFLVEKGGRNKEQSASVFSPPNKTDGSDDWCRKIGKAAALVMLQPSAPARARKAWIHVPSQPLMRSPLSRFQTPASPRRVSRFFRVWLLFRLPCRADRSAYFGRASFISPILSAVDVGQTKQLLDGCQCNS